MFCVNSEHCFVVALLERVNTSGMKNPGELKVNQLTRPKSSSQMCFKFGSLLLALLSCSSIASCDVDCAMSAFGDERPAVPDVSFFDLPAPLQEILKEVPTILDTCYQELPCSDQNMQDMEHEFDAVFRSILTGSMSAADAELEEAFRLDADANAESMSENALEAIKSDDYVSKLAKQSKMMLDEVMRSAQERFGYDDALVWVISHKKKELPFPMQLDWHVDFTPAEELGLSTNDTGHVVIISLKGDTTLYRDLSPTEREAILSACDTTGHVYCDVINNKADAEVVSREIPPDRAILSAEAGAQGSVHRSGRQSGTLHSVPGTTDRLLLIITLGNRTVIQALKKRRKSMGGTCGIY